MDSGWSTTAEAAALSVSVSESHVAGVADDEDEEDVHHEVNTEDGVYTRSDAQKFGLGVPGYDPRSGSSSDELQDGTQIPSQGPIPDIQINNRAHHYHPASVPSLSSSSQSLTPTERPNPPEHRDSALSNASAFSTGSGGSGATGDESMRYYMAIEQKFPAPPGSPGISLGASLVGENAGGGGGGFAGVGAGAGGRLGPKLGIGATVSLPYLNVWADVDSLRLDCSY